MTAFKQSANPEWLSHQSLPRPLNFTQFQTSLKSVVCYELHFHPDLGYPGSLAEVATKRPSLRWAWR